MRFRIRAWRSRVWAVAMLALARAPALGQPPSPLPDGSAGVTASNQSVALPPAGPGSSATGTGLAAVDPSPSAPIGAHTAPETTTASKEPRADRESPRRFRRSSAAAGEGGEESPWYRTSLGATAVVLALITGAYCAARKVLPSLAVQESRGVRVLSRAALTPRQSVALVAVGRRVLVVGIGAESVRLLVDVSDPVEASELAARSGARDVKQDRAFEQALEREVVAFERESAAARTTDETTRPSHGSPTRFASESDAGDGACDDGAERAWDSGDPVEQLRSRLRALRSKHGARVNRVA